MPDRIHLPPISIATLSWTQFLAREQSDPSDTPSLIVFPRAAPHPDFPRLIDDYWKDLPDDWDAVSLGAYAHTPPIHVAGHVFRPTAFSTIHGLALRGRAITALKQSSHASAEACLNALIQDQNLNIYSLWPNLICPTDHASHSPADHFNSFSKLGHHGRMGNQFFQLAATLGAAVRHGYRPKFPHWNYAEILAEPIDQSLNINRITSTYNEPHFHFAPIPPDPNLDLLGVFQSPRYFHGYENLILQYLRPSPKLNQALKTRFADLLAKPTVALHVRRADYVGLAHGFVTLPLDYYRAAMRLFPPGSHFVVFSDDPAWCQTAFKSDPVEIISGNPGYADLFLMAACQHQIIANSTFSWWAAYLNSNPHKQVIAPKSWFGPSLSQNNIRDLYPLNWTLL